IGGDARPPTAVDLRPPHPRPQRLPSDPQLPGHPSYRATLRALRPAHLPPPPPPAAPPSAAPPEPPPTARPPELPRHAASPSAAASPTPAQSLDPATPAGTSSVLPCQDILPV